MTTRKEARLPWTHIAPKPYAALAGVSASLGNSTLGKQLYELVQSRVSQINGCAFCVDMHARDLRKQGESWQRLNALAVWRESGLFNERESAALAWAETLTRLPGEDRHAERDAAFEALKLHFNDQEIVELSWTIAQINAWNRMAIGMAQSLPGAAIE